jgi:hypothetical protein
MSLVSHTVYYIQSASLVCRQGTKCLSELYCIDYEFCILCVYIELLFGLIFSCFLFDGPFFCIFFSQYVKSIDELGPSGYLKIPLQQD